MNHRRHLLDRGRGFKFGETHLSHDGTRGHASRQNYDNICSTKHCFPTDKKQTPRQEDIQRRKQKFDPGGEGGEKPSPWNAAAMVVFLFLSRERWAWGARCLCFVFLSCLLCSLSIVPFG